MYVGNGGISGVPAPRQYYCCRTLLFSCVEFPPGGPPRGICGRGLGHAPGGVPRGVRRPRPPLLINAIIIYFINVNINIIFIILLIINKKKKKEIKKKQGRRQDRR